MKKQNIEQDGIEFKTRKDAIKFIVKAHKYFKTMVFELVPAGRRFYVVEKHC